MEKVCIYTTITIYTTTITIYTTTTTHNYYSLYTYYVGT